MESLAAQSVSDFEVVVVDDGSKVACRDICEKYSGKLDLKYFFKENSGPAQSRNYGTARAMGSFFIILDSDVTLSSDYFAKVVSELSANPCDAFGGPDRAHPSFSVTQKAISYAMTSFLTTGGIRGGVRRRAMDKFYPRSFNMGISREAFEALGGFADMRYGEDIDLSIRIYEAGYSCRLFPEAWVWHKRRTTLSQFFWQVFHSGEARIALWQRHPASLKMVHLLPAAFVVGVSVLVVLTAIGISFSPWAWLFLSPIALFGVVIFVDACARSRSMAVGIRSVAAACVQLAGYGLGFIAAWRHSKRR